jgi:hypothetical protein
MPPSNTRYEEAMKDAEFSFLQEKANKEKGMFIRVVRNLSVIFVIIPCCIGIIMESLKRSQSTPYMNAIQDQDDPYVIQSYFVGMIILLLIVAVCSTLYYFNTLWKIQKDLKRNTKTIEQTTIDRKQFIKTNDSCHFYLNSRTQLSIEVSKQDFERFDEGDEVNIEYSSYSKVYFGYF